MYMVSDKLVSAVVFQVMIVKTGMEIMIVTIAEMIAQNMHGHALNQCMNGSNMIAKRVADYANQVRIVQWSPV